MVLVNDKAIDFTLLDDNGLEFKLSNNNDKTIILYFYSKDNTSACTAQALSYKELYKEFNKLNVLIIGISKDSVESHKKFKLKYELPFILLSDKDKEVVSLYDCLKEKNMYGKKVIGTLRSSFVIRNGVIIKANYNVKAKDDALNNLEFIKNN